jgi:hypothetical protein
LDSSDFKDTVRKCDIITRQTDFEDEGKAERGIPIDKKPYRPVAPRVDVTSWRWGFYGGEDEEERNQIADRQVVAQPTKAWDQDQVLSGSRR